MTCSGGKDFDVKCYIREFLRNVQGKKSSKCKHGGAKKNFLSMCCVHTYGLCMPLLCCFEQKVRGGGVQIRGEMKNRVEQTPMGGLLNNNIDEMASKWVTTEYQHCQK